MVSCAEYNNKRNCSPVVNLTVPDVLFRRQPLTHMYPHSTTVDCPRFQLNFECFTTNRGLIILITEPMHNSNTVSDEHILTFKTIDNIICPCTLSLLIQIINGHSGWLESTFCGWASTTIPVTVTTESKTSSHLKFAFVR